MMNVIEAHGLSRTYVSAGQRVEAVRGIDFAVRSGEIFGFLGRNGAGKSTTLRMLATLLRPTAGSATIMGCDLQNDPAGIRRRVGFVAQHGGADTTSTVRKDLVLQARLYGLTRSEATDRAAEVAGMFGLRELLDRKTEGLSGGQRRRLEIAFGLVHRPKLVFLDEPTAGLDPPSRAQLWRHIRRLRDEHGVTVFLTTHYLEEADALCDRILILDQGRVVAEDTPEALKNSLAGDAVTVKVADDVEAARAALVRRPDVHEVSVTDHTLRFTAPHDEAMVVEIVRTLEAAKIAPTAIEIARPSLDDVFLAVTGEPLSDPDAEAEAEESALLA